MAHRFSIPIVTRYVSQRLKWEACSYSIAGRKSDFPEDRPTFLGTDVPIPLLPFTGPPLVPDYPLVKLHRHSAGSPRHYPDNLYYTLSEDFSAAFETVTNLQLEGKAVPESMSKLLVVFEHGTVPEREMNAWEMRDDFMRLEESSDALLAFLNRWGLWSTPTLLHTEFSQFRVVSRLGLGDQPYVVLPHIVWLHRKLFRDGMLGPATAWLTERAALGGLHRRDRFPYFGLTDRTCAQAIETTITLDHMRRVKSRMCARADCKRVFTVESNHGQIYCQQYCGHLASLRRNRERAKSAKKPAKRRRL